MQDKPVTVVETTLFLRHAAGIWSDDDRAAFVDFIASNPETGDIIPGTGGVRKVRWARPGSGKRGGARVIYFYYHSNAPIYLLFAYAKAQRTDMTQDEKKAVATLAAHIKSEFPPERKE